MEEIDLMDIAYRIIPILREEKLTYNQAKEVLECCEFLLGDECRMLCAESIQIPSRRASLERSRDRAACRELECRTHRVPKSPKTVQETLQRIRDVKNFLHRLEHSALRGQKQQDHVEVVCRKNHGEHHCMSQVLQSDESVHPV